MYLVSFGSGFGDLRTSGPLDTNVYDAPLSISMQMLWYAMTNGTRVITTAPRLRGNGGLVMHA